jgi:SAM-dependent methyltransferase
VTKKNRYLNDVEQLELQQHYPVMMNSKHYPAKLAATIYANRRTHPIDNILETERATVCDAGCGYGSESFLFGALGAKVLAVDLSSDRITIARKRQRYYEDVFRKSMDITFVVADLDKYTPEASGLSLTWLASVLAAIRSQGVFLERIYDVTQSGGKVMITDMNLLNPIFLLKEWRRRFEARRKNIIFSQHADFWAMLQRKNREGARFFENENGKCFDDVQFFSPRTLTRLLEVVGFSSIQRSFSGFLPPFLFKEWLVFFEGGLSQMPLIRSLGYFYLVTGVKR